MDSSGDSETDTFKLLSIFLNTYVTEDMLNEELKLTEELSLLRILLKIKWQLIQCHKHTFINYPLNVLLNNLPEKIDEVCLILEIALQIQQDESQYVSLLHYIYTYFSRTELGDISPYLKLLHFVLLQSIHERERGALLSFMDSNDFEFVINRLLDIDDRSTINYITVNILPKYLNLVSSHTVKTLDYIWKRTIQTKKLDVLCACHNFFWKYLVLNSPSYCEFLQNCLESSSNIQQKQAVFLLKETVDLFEVYNCKLSNGTRDIETYVSAWRNLITLYEIVREKQLHLVEPAYKLLPSITVLDPSWLLSIYKVLLCHPHNSVCAFTIVDLLRSKWFHEISSFEQMIAYLLLSVNKLPFATNETIWGSLRAFVERVCERNFNCLLKESAKIRWIPSICYMFYTNILFRNNVSLSPSIVEKLISNISNVPHKLIRTKCLHLVSKSVSTNVDFNSFIRINWLLNHDSISLESSRLGNYSSDIKTIVNSWQNDWVDLQYVPLILTVVEVLDNELTIELLRLFEERKLNPNVADQLCIRFQSNKLDTVRYLQTRLPDLRATDPTVLKGAVSRLEFEKLNRLISSSTRILLDEASNSSQIEVAFEIVREWVDKGGDVNCVAKVVDKWCNQFLSGISACASISCNFVQLYSKSKFGVIISSEVTLDTIHIFQQMIERHQSAVLPIIFSQLGCLYNSCEIDPLLVFLDFCIKELKELKGSDAFKIATTNLVHSLLLNSEILHGNVRALEKSSSMLWDLLQMANSCEDIAYSIAITVHKLSEISPTATAPYIPIIVQLLLFGEVLQKDQRADYMVCQLIYVKTLENNLHHPRTAVRGLAVKCVENLLKTEERKENADAIVSLLLKKYAATFNKRYFSDSQIHLNKLRIVQALLLVDNNTDQQKQPLIDTLLNSLSQESHQTNVKFFIIWLLIRLLNDTDDFMEVIKSKMEKTSKVQPSTIIAFIPLLYHLALFNKDEEVVYSKVFEIMLPWTMGAHFNLRLHAQIGFAKLYNIIEREEHGRPVCDEYKHVMSCITEVLTKTERRIDRFEEYIFDWFNPSIDYHMHVIYYGIPHLTRLTCDEYENMFHIFPIADNLARKYSLCSEFWRLPEPSQIKHQSENFNTNTIQKKITPYEANKPMTDMIVVASLINKSPNLGGLSRTCEVFGIKQLIVNSLSVVKNSEFRSLSMSSENWVNIMEVKLGQLQQFLLNMKELGYTVVGAEQTSDSIKLNQFKFPSKCVLVLGNEKEGISANLLSFIDQCVEIPQLGVVRSLNVHVAAAMFIWEYTKSFLV